MNPPIHSYDDYTSFSTIALTEDFAAASAKAVNDMLLSWGFDPEDCYQETFLLDMGERW